jgi:hypothetical protein
VNGNAAREFDAGTNREGSIEAPRRTKPHGRRRGRPAYEAGVDDPSRDLCTRLPTKDAQVSSTISGGAVHLSGLLDGSGWDMAERPGPPPDGQQAMMGDMALTLLCVGGGPAGERCHSTIAGCLCPARWRVSASILGRSVAESPRR